MKIGYEYKEADFDEIFNCLDGEGFEIGCYEKEKIVYSLLDEFKIFNYPGVKEGSNFWWRLSLLPYLIISIILWISLPFKFVITGIWGYNTCKWKWLIYWEYKATQSRKGE